MWSWHECFGSCLANQKHCCRASLPSSASPVHGALAHSFSKQGSGDCVGSRDACSSWILAAGRDFSFPSSCYPVVLQACTPGPLCPNPMSPPPWHSASERHGESREVSVASSGKARRALLVSTKPPYHRTVANGAGYPPWH